MSDHLVDTPVKLGQCNRCQQYVWLAMASGVRSAADVAPAAREAYVAALVDGRRTFGLITQAGRPWKLSTRRLGDPAPVFGSQGLQEPPEGSRAVLVEHGCGGHARNMVSFREVEQGPPPARATHGGSRSGGPHPVAAHESGLVVEEIPRRSPVRPASHLPSEAYPKCGTCQRYVKSGEMYWGIQHGPVWIYCEHEECP